MEDRETARMRTYGESKTTRIMMATVPHVTSGLGLSKFQADGFLLTRLYINLIVRKLREYISFIDKPFKTRIKNIRNLNTYFLLSTLLWFCFRIWRFITFRAIFIMYCMYSLPVCYPKS